MLNKPILKINNLEKSFGAIKALQLSELEINLKELCGIVGPNGSGKTTLFDCITNIVKPDKGKIIIHNQNILDFSSDIIVKKLKVGRTFQKISIFRSMTLEENLLVAGLMHNFPNLFSTFLHGIKTKKRLNFLKYRAAELLELIGLIKMKHTLSDELSFGQQKLLQFAMILMGDFRIILLDEPFAGVNPILIEQIVSTIKNINSTKETIFIIIEHNFDVLMKICPRIVVLDQGRKIADGLGSDVIKDPKVIEAYLG